MKLDTQIPGHRRLVAVLAVVAAMFVVQAPVETATASTKTGKVMVNTQRMSGPSLTTTQYGWYSKGSTLSLVCYQRGQSVYGYFGGPDSIWYKVSDGKYVADIDLDTGSNNPITPACTSSLSSRVDAFVAKWNGKYADYDLVYGAQCFDLFNFYNRDVVHAARASGMYAYQIWDTYDRSKYTRVAAGSTPRKGDVAVWSSSYPNGSGGAGHVAIVLGTSGSGFTALTQNPGATHITTFSKAYLRGFLRPNG
jgi:hypothetical protein